ncbi:MAG: DUF1538 domain-containing protein [Ruminococcaceae bacterium]|nr:DUF1538 domain-containing protein [Oscillospiraceae bacterium]
MKQLRGALAEAISSVLPISAIVLLLSVSVAPMNAGVLVLFLFGTIMLIFGMSLFTIGSEISMKPLGEGIGVQLNKSKKMLFPLIICFVLGVLITIAEPDLQVLAEQVPSIPNSVLIISVAIGVGLFLSIALYRARKNVPLSRLLLVFYIFIIALAFFAPEDFIPTAFDSGGVTTGPITVPFIMALGAGMASISKDKRSNENSFGLIALCSIGPILSVLILSICFNPEPETTETVLAQIDTTVEAFMEFARAIPRYAEEVLVAFLPIVGVFLVFQLISRRFHRHQIIKISVGLLYTFVGLVLFLTGANVGFMPAGRLIGSEISGGEAGWLLIPIGMIMGYFVVSAEPAVHSLKKQVEEVTNGAISQNAVGYALSIGVAVSLGISMLRVLTGIPVLPFLIVGYTVSLVITFFVPPIYTGIAFDSGGVASGPMTTTFILSFAMGACEMLGGNLMTDAFGIVAMVAMTPLITIQVMGLNGHIKQRRMREKAHKEFIQIEDDIIYYDDIYNVSEEETV